MILNFIAFGGSHCQDSMFTAGATVQDETVVSAGLKCY